MRIVIDKDRFVSLIKSTLVDTKEHNNTKDVTQIHKILHCIDLMFWDFSLPKEPEDLRNKSIYEDFRQKFCSFFDSNISEFQKIRDAITPLNANKVEFCMDKAPTDTKEKLLFYSTVFFSDKIPEVYGNGVIKKQGQKEIFKTIANLTLHTTHFESASAVYYSRQERNENSTEENPWGRLIKQTYPSTDIIIVDPYFFDPYLKSLDKKNIEQKDREKNSAFWLLDLLLKQMNKVGTNVIFFVEYHNKYPNKEKLPEKEFEIRVNEYWQEFNILMDRYKEVFNTLKDKYNNSNFTIIINRSNVNKKHLGLHDRYIITNYRFYISGHSFSQYFDKGGKFTANGSIWFCENSVIEPDYIDIVSTIIDDQLKPIIEGCKEGDIYGNCKSKLLNKYLDEWVKNYNSSNII